MFISAGCPPHFGNPPIKETALAASKVIADNLCDVTIVQEGIDRRIVVEGRDEEVFVAVFDENNPAFPIIETVSLPGVTIERLYIRMITAGSFDLVIKTSTGIIFLEGQFDGSFADPPRQIFTGQLDAAADGNVVTFIDADKDGDTDIVAAGSRAGTVPPNSVEAHLLINDGNGNFSNPHTLQQPTDIVTLNNVTSGDVNNDGFAEVALSGANTRLLTVNNTSFLYYSTSTGQSQPAPTTPIEGSGGDTALVDLNSDNRSDFVSTKPSGGVNVRLAQPNGGLGPVQNYTGGFFGRLLTGDFNADGHTDVAAHSYSPGGLSVYQGDGSGVLAPPQTVDAPTNAYRLDFVPALAGSIFPACFYTVDPVAETIQTYTMGPDGPISTDRRPYTRDGDPVSTRDAAIADVNGDGYPDLIACESFVPELNFALNAADGSGLFLPNQHDRVALLDRIAPMRPVDGQGDSRAAIAVTVSGSTTAAVLRLNSTTDPTAWVAFSIFSLPEPGVDVATGDIDGDGRDDALFSHAGGNRAFTVARQQPGGSFALGASFFVPGGAWSRIATADLDGDGDPEVIVLDPASGEIRTLRNDGAGNFNPVAAGAIAFAPPLSSNVAVGDIDGDGNVDVMVGAGPAAPANGSVQVIRGDGNAGFLDALSTPTPGRVEAVALGDIENDGFPDLLFAVASGSTFVDGSLGLASGTPTGLSASISYHYISGDPKGVFIVDLKNPALRSGRSRSSSPSVVVAAHSQVFPYEGISVLEPLAVAECAGDLNGDGLVDDADFVIFLAAYNLLDCADPNMPSGCPADLNSDDSVDDADFVEFVAAYNQLLCD
jgi:hypothetical protein